MGIPTGITPVDLGEGYGYSQGIAVSMGNPHLVIFVDQVSDVRLSEVGPLLEHHPLFPDRVNVEFAQVIDGSHIRMRVWERGSGITLACGTGACATAVPRPLRGGADVNRTSRWTEEPFICNGMNPTDIS